MKHLIIYAHPNPASLSHAYVEALEATWKAKGHSVEVRDLYALNFNPVLGVADFKAIQSGTVLPEIAVEQKYIAEADVITFVYPIWWVGLPAIVKGYIDRVFLNGFAYKYTETGPVGLLNTKKVLVFNNMGTPNMYYEQSGMDKSLLQTSDAGIFNFSGIEVAEHHLFGGVPSIDDAARKELIEKVKAVAAKY